MQAHGILRGFDLRAEGSTVHVGAGQAYCQGFCAEGGYEFDARAMGDGWHALIAMPTGVAYGPTMHVRAVPLYWVEVAGGRVMCVRDVRRWLTWWRWDRGLASGAPWLDWWPSCAARVRRVQSAVQHRDEDGGLYWVATECSLGFGAGDIVVGPLATPIGVHSAHSLAVGLIIEWQEA